MLFEPFTLRCGVVLPNRIALAPLTNLQSHADGLLADAELEFLARRADGGFGLISTCAAYVVRDGKAWEGELGIDRDECLPGLTALATRLHAGGARAIVQLFHGGVRADSALTGEPVWSASAFTDGAPEGVVPRAGTEQDIETVIGRFVDAAVRAQRAGFEGAELHGAHGYLLSQFLSRTMNLRSDAWGGDIAGRARLLREITQRIRARCGPGFMLGVRVSLEDFGQAKGLDLDESLQVLRWLVEDGIDFIHISLWDVTRMTAKRADEHPLALVRAIVPREVAVFAAGKIWSREDAEETLERGADVVALGRSAIVNPDWPQRVRSSVAIERPPVTRAALAARAVSPRFVDYLTRWKNFIAD